MRRLDGGDGDCDNVGGVGFFLEPESSLDNDASTVGVFGDAGNGNGAIRSSGGVASNGAYAAFIPNEGVADSAVGGECFFGVLSVPPGSVGDLKTSAFAAS